MSDIHTQRANAPLRNRLALMVRPLSEPATAVAEDLVLSAPANGLNKEANAEHLRALTIAAPLNQTVQKIYAASKPLRQEALDQAEEGSRDAAEAEDRLDDLIRLPKRSYQVGTVTMNAKQVVQHADDLEEAAAAAERAGNFQHRDRPSAWKLWAATIVFTATDTILLWYAAFNPGSNPIWWILLAVILALIGFTFHVSMKEAGISLRRKNQVHDDRHRAVDAVDAAYSSIEPN